MAELWNEIAALSQQAKLALALLAALAAPAALGILWALAAVAVGAALEVLEWPFRALDRRDQRENYEPAPPLGYRRPF